MRIEYIAVGDELLIGTRAETNSLILERKLLSVGVEVDRVHVVRDDRDSLSELFQEVAARADAAVISGGLGTTHDDLTRDALAGAMGVSLVPNPQAKAEIEAFVRRRNRSMQPTFGKMWELPDGAECLANPVGLAPGVCARVSGKPFYGLPGVPREFDAMVDSAVIPGLGLHRSKTPFLSQTIHLVGVPESKVGEAISPMVERIQALDHDSNEPLRLGITAHLSVVSLRIQVPVRHREEIDVFLAEVESRFGEQVLGRGDVDLVSWVAQRLIATQTTLAVAESCTGGRLAAALTSVPGISSVFLEGAVTYSNEAKMRTLDVDPDVLAKHGAVSTQVAEAMATGMAARAGSDLGIGITGVAGPGGGSPEKPVGLVYIGFFDRGHVDVTELRTGGTRESIQEQSVLSALDRIRRSFARS